MGQREILLTHETVALHTIFAGNPDESYGTVHGIGGAQGCDGLHGSSRHPPLVVPYSVCSDPAAAPVG